MLGCKLPHIAEFGDMFISQVTDTVLTVQKAPFGDVVAKPDSEKIICDRILTFAACEPINGIFVGQMTPTGEYKITLYKRSEVRREWMESATIPLDVRPLHLATNADGHYLSVLSDVQLIDGRVTESVAMYDIQSGTCLCRAALPSPAVSFALDMVSTAPVSSWSGLYCCPSDDNVLVAVSPDVVVVLRVSRLCTTYTFAQYPLSPPTGQTFSGAGCFPAHGYRFLAAVDGGLVDIITDQESSAPMISARVADSRKHKKKRHASKKATAEEKAAKPSTRPAVEFKPQLEPQPPIAGLPGPIRALIPSGKVVVLVCDTTLIEHHPTRLGPTRPPQQHQLATIMPNASPEAIFVAVTGPLTTSTMMHVIAVADPGTGMTTLATIPTTVDGYGQTVATHARGRVVSSRLIRVPECPEELLLTVHSSGVVTCHDLVTGTFEFSARIQSTAAPTAVATCPVKSLVMIGDEAGAVRIFKLSPLMDGSQLTLIGVERMFTGPVASLSCAHDGSLLAAISTGAPVAIGFMDLTSLDAIKYIGSMPFSVDPTPSPTLHWAIGLRSGAWVKLLYASVTPGVIWRLGVGSLKPDPVTLKIPSTAVSRVELRVGLNVTDFAIHPNTGQDDVYIAHDKGASLFHFMTTQSGADMFEQKTAAATAIRTIATPSPVTALAISPRSDGTLLLLGLADGAALLVKDADRAESTFPTVTLEANHYSPEGPVAAMAASSRKDIMADVPLFVTSAGSDGSVAVAQIDEVAFLFNGYGGTACDSADAGTFAAAGGSMPLPPPDAPPEAVPDPGSDCLTPGQRLEAMQAEEKEEEIKQIRGRTAKKLERIRADAQALIEKNAAREEIDRVSTAALTVDTDLESRLRAEAEGRIAAEQTLGAAWQKVRTVLADVAIEAVYGQLESLEHGDVVTGLVRDISVAAFPLLRLTPEQTARVEAVRYLRAIELAASDVNRRMPVDDGTEAPATDDAGDDEAADGHPTLPSVSQCLYSPSELTTRARRVSQTILLEACGREIRAEFNAAYNKLVVAKMDTIDKLKDKEARVEAVVEEIHSLQTKLGQPLTTFTLPSMTYDVTGVTKADPFFVAPDEVEVPRVYSAEEKRAIKKAEEEEEAHRKALAGDQAALRALDDMMGGRLEVQAVDELETLISERPAALDIPEADRTDEMVVEIKAFNSKVKKLEDERVKRVKGLEGELKRTKEQMTELAASFEARLKEVQLARVTATREAAVHQLQTVHLLTTHLGAVDVKAATADVEAQINQVKADHMAAMTVHEEMSAIEAAEQATLVEVTRRDRSKRQPVRQRIAGNEAGNVSDAVIDELSKLVNRRPAAEILYQRLVADAEGSSTRKPLLALPAAVVNMSGDDDEAEAAKLAAILSEPDRAAVEAATGVPVPSECWAEMLAIRAERALHEVRTLHQRLVVADVRDALTTSTAAIDAYMARQEALEARRVTLSQDADASTFDGMVVARLMQGQIEVPQDPVATDYSEAIMVDSSLIGDYNTEIGHLARSLIASLESVRDNRSACSKIRWQMRHAALTIEDVQAQTTDLQLYRVRREMRDMVHAPDADSLHRQEVEMLGKQLAHMRAQDEKMANGLKQQIASTRRQIKRYAAETAKTNAASEQLRAAIAERSRLYAVQQRARENSGPAGHMSGLAQKRKVERAIKAQRDAAVTLTAEVERLRRKTFPSFAEVKTQMDVDM